MRLPVSRDYCHRHASTTTTKGNRMRPIKFRAWITDARRGTCSMMSMEDLCFVDCGSYSSKLLDVLDGSDTESVLMQFTGLLDSQGVEIYEGDIVRSHAHNPSLYQVIYDQGCYFASSRSCNIELWHFDDSTGCCLEVIGNIHEHPELLK